MGKCLETSHSVNECVTRENVMFVVWRIVASRGESDSGKGSPGFEARSVFRISRRKSLANDVLRE